MPFRRIPSDSPLTRFSARARSADCLSRRQAATVDLEKVAALRQAISDGSFKVDPETIYTGLVADAREMIDIEPT